MIRSPARLLAALSLALAACSTPAADARFTERVPDRADFAPVAQGLEHRCGTLDCHGSSYRNLRIFGNESLRLRATDQPLSPPCTTPEEVDEDFASVVGLEPEAMTEVARGHGADPTLLLLVRKARGTEGHKGGKVTSAGDDLDRCITSWLAGPTDAAACARAAPPTLPPPMDGQAPRCEPGP